jgi:HD-like signal output (HDOD) protein
MTPQELAGEVSSLFSLPDLVVRACAVMDSPSSTAQDLIEVIELDANLAATVLRLANSVLFAGRGNIATLNRAVALIGQNAVRDLVLATAAVDTFRGVSKEAVDMDSFWENSTTCAVIVRLIAGRGRMRDGESLFLSGLLHSVGRLVFLARLPVECGEALALVRSGELSLNDAEVRVFGFSHAEVGAALLEGWGLPERLYLPVRYQLDPAVAPDFPRECAILHLAAEMACDIAPCLKTMHEAETYVPNPLAVDCMQLLGLTPAVLTEISLDAMAASLEVLEIIKPTTSVTYC